MLDTFILPFVCRVFLCVCVCVLSKFRPHCHLCGYSPLNEDLHNLSFSKISLLSTWTAAILTGFPPSSCASLFPPHKCHANTITLKKNLLQKPFVIFWLFHRSKPSSQHVPWGPSWVTSVCYSSLCFFSGSLFLPSSPGKFYSFLKNQSNHCCLDSFSPSPDRAGSHLHSWVFLSDNTDQVVRIVCSSVSPATLGTPRLLCILFSWHLVLGLGIQ